MITYEEAVDRIHELFLEMNPNHPCREEFEFLLGLIETYDEDLGINDLIKDYEEENK